MRRSIITVLLVVIIAVFAMISSFSVFATETVTNAQMLDMCIRVDDFMNLNVVVPQIIYTDSQQTNSVTAAEFYYMMARWLRYYKANNIAPATVEIRSNIMGPSSPSGIETGRIYQVDLLEKGKTSADFIDANHCVPNYITVNGTQYTPESFFWVMVRAIRWYGENGVLPNYVTVRFVHAPEKWMILP